MYDFGLSSHQIDSEYRGFSYQANTLLDMRMNTKQNLTAENIVNNYTENDLTKVLRTYSEDKYSKKISKKIIESRPILTTNELVNVIKDAVPKQNPIYIEKTSCKERKIELIWSWYDSSRWLNCWISSSIKNILD